MEVTLPVTDAAGQACQIQCQRRARSGDHHMGEENHDLILLLIPGLSLRYAFCSSTFPQARKCEFRWNTFPLYSV